MILLGEVCRAESAADKLFMTSYVRNALLPDGSPAVKQDVEGICSAMRERMFTPGIKTLKAAIEIIPNPLQAPIDAAADGSAACQT
jgi:hypothetical protein